MKTMQLLLALLSIMVIGILPVRAQDKPFECGVCGHPYAQEAYWHVPVTTQLDLVARLGAKWYRVDWSQKNFQANTEKFDTLLSEAEKRHLKLLPILYSSPGPGSKDATPEQIRAGAYEYGKAMASRYRGRITHWELNNERDIYAMIRKGEKRPDGTIWTWDGAPDGSSPNDYEDTRYGKVLAEYRGLVEGVRAADPKAKVMVDTAGWLHYGFLERLIKQDRLDFDIIAWHWYSEMGDMTKVQGKTDVLAILAAHGKPIWITEINRRGGSMGGKEQEQADYLAKVAAQLKAHPAVQAFIAYELLDQPYFGETNPESHYGLVTVERGEDKQWKAAAPKPAFDAYRAAIAGGTKATGGR